MPLITRSLRWRSTPDSADAAECARITAEHARTFSLASRLLPAHKRRAANALYAFCRVADDLVDQVDAEPFPERAAKLEAYRTHLATALAGTAEDAIFREVAWAVNTFRIPSAPLFELLGGVQQDLRVPHYADWAAVARYCEGVASSVGEMCAYVFGLGVREPSAAFVASAVQHARTLGLAMQLTNILRDVGEDARRGRCYLPADELAQFGLSIEDVLQRTPTLPGRDGWAPFMRFQIARARALYAEATPGIALLASDAQGCALACAEGYAGILSAIEAQRYDTVSRRARVSTPARARLLWKAWRHRAAPAPIMPLPTGPAPLREARAL